jgi:hypothetical protein
VFGVIGLMMRGPEPAGEEAIKLDGTFVEPTKDLVVKKNHLDLIVVVVKGGAHDISIRAGGRGGEAAAGGGVGDHRKALSGRDGTLELTLAHNVFLPIVASLTERET